MSTKQNSNCKIAVFIESVQKSKHYKSSGQRSKFKRFVNDDWIVCIETYFDHFTTFHTSLDVILQPIH